MPVAISEWRVRIGTFIHRIKEWVVREMREELLKERIQRLRDLWKRLQAKKDDSEGGSQDHKTREDEVDSSDSLLERSFGGCRTFTASPSNQAVDEQLSQQPNLQESMLVRAGDVEVNPGPPECSIDMALQDKELMLLARDVPGNLYDALCISLGFSYIEGQNVLTKHLLDIPGALIELFCRWKIKQKDGTDCRAVLGGILKDTNMGSLQTKLLEGKYLKSETEENVPNQGGTQQAMTEEQVSRCAEELKLFYREEMWKIKPDPSVFDLIFELKEIYTNLTLLRNEMGITKKKGSLNYKDLLTTKINGLVPTRLLVEGEGGAGKTTLCSKIAWDWTNGSKQYNHFSWVLVLPLRNVNKGEAIGDIIKNYLDDSNNVSPEQIENYMKSHPSKVLIILDGFDEYNGDLSTDDSSDISRILRFEIFKRCAVLVTTRPWRADQIKCNQKLSSLYCFIAVKGFSTKNVSKYITKFFVNDKQSGIDLRQFIQGNYVIKKNMAPFPIYVAMLCVLWNDISVEKREIISKLKTFSQLFEQMIIFLRDHYLSKLKSTNYLNEEQSKKEKKNAEKRLHEIGSVALNGLLEKKLVFKDDDFSSCKDAMTTSCKIGVLSREQKQIPRLKQSMRDSQAVTENIFFPHKLFQEYVASLYLASVYESDLQKYNRLMERLIEGNPKEFRFLLYFTAAQLKEAGLDIVDRLHHLYSGKEKSERKKTDITFLVDVTFEAYHEDTAKRVGQWLDAEDRALTINKSLSAHTVSGYLFINEHHGVKTLDVRNTKLGSSTSLVIANAVLSSSSLTTLKFLGTNLHDDFYKFILDQISKNGTTTSNVQMLYTDHRRLVNYTTLAQQLN
nr:NLR family CARD domain-containing protein 4-like [Lytechinus pictus]